MFSHVVVFFMDVGVFGGAIMRRPLPTLLGIMSSSPLSPLASQVNSISMLGKTLAEAIRVFQGVLDRINLLVCSGYDPSNKAVISWQTSGGGGRGVVVEAVDESGSVVGGNSLYDWRTPACDGGGSSNDGVLV